MPQRHHAHLLSAGLACLAGLALLAGCERLDQALRPTERIQIGEDAYQLRLRPTRYDIPERFVPSELGRAALDACPDGYVRDRQWSTEDEGSRLYLWDIHCGGS